MVKEIGSEFWDIPLVEKKNNAFDKATWFISGRAAFRAILQIIEEQIGNKELIKVAIPSYLCESMITPLEKEQLSYKFYKVEFDGHKLKFDYSNIDDCNVVVIIDYFGYEMDSKHFPAKGKILIRDLTQSIFTKKYNDADYYFGSLRKWAGFKSGGFAYARNNTIPMPKYSLDEYVSLRHTAMLLKKEYIIGKQNEKDYLTLFQKAELMLNSCDIASSSLDDIESAQHLDIDLIKETRRRNANILIDGLKKYCMFDCLSNNDCPLFVPIIYKSRDELKKHLIKNNIYCPVHWPKPFDGDMSRVLYEQELSLVCDQRYTEKEMYEIVQAVRDFIEREENA